MSKIVNLGDRRPPVTYTVHITHHWDDRLEVFVEDVADDDRSRASVADSLFRAASMFEKKAALSAAPSPVGDRDALIERLDDTCPRTGLPHAYWPQGQCQYCGALAPAALAAREQQP